MIRRLLTLIFLLPAAAAGARADGRAPDSAAMPQPALVIRADVDSAIVILDGRRLGRTPLTIDSIAPGTHTVRLLHPDISNWMAGVLDDTLRVVQGDHKVCLYRFRKAVLFSTIPAGASVYIRDSLAGTTPLLVTDRRDGETGSLAVSKNGYEPTSVSPWESPRGYTTLTLTPLDQHAEEESIASESAPGPRIGPARIFLSGAAMAVTGVATAYLKIKADNREALYQQTGNAALLSERNRLDRGAAVTLVLTQIGFGFFVYYLLSE